MAHRVHDRAIAADLRELDTPEARHERLRRGVGAMIGRRVGGVTMIARDRLVMVPPSSRGEPASVYAPWMSRVLPSFDERLEALRGA